MASLTFLPIEFRDATPAGVRSAATARASVAEAGDQDLGVRDLGDIVDVRRIAAIETVRRTRIRVSDQAFAHAGCEGRAPAGPRGAARRLVGRIAIRRFITASARGARVAGGASKLEGGGAATAARTARRRAGRPACGRTTGGRPACGRTTAGAAGTAGRRIVAARRRGEQHRAESKHCQQSIGLHDLTCPSIRAWDRAACRPEVSAPLRRPGSPAT